ncbi:MAG: hypothetical protein HFF18_07510 [Oscillospiraceae bacterium]|nr:hypothetical protein [Oscillospiraceae bacterium]
MERKKAGKRKAEVGGLFAKLYGDWAAGRVMEYNFNMLTPKYQTVQGKLAEKIDTLTVELRAYPRIRRVQIAPSAFSSREAKPAGNPLWIAGDFGVAWRKICRQDACESI